MLLVFIIDLPFDIVSQGTFILSKNSSEILPFLYISWKESAINFSSSSKQVSSMSSLKVHVWIRFR